MVQVGRKLSSLKDFQENDFPVGRSTLVHLLSSCANESFDSGNRVIDTFDSITDAHLLYHFLVKNFTNPYALLSPTW